MAVNERCQLLQTSQLGQRLTFKLHSGPLLAVSVPCTSGGWGAPFYILGKNI